MTTPIIPITVDIYGHISTYDWNCTAYQETGAQNQKPPHLANTGQKISGTNPMTCDKTIHQQLMAPRKKNHSGAF
jgi:hypothetical protein